MFTQPVLFALAAAVLITMAPASVEADVYASPPLYGGTASGGGGGVAGAVTCRVFNAGSKGVNITKRRIYNSSDVSVTLEFDSCGVALGSNKYCHFGYNASLNETFSCKMVTEQDGTKLRGVAEFRSYSDGSIVNALPMTK